MNILRFLLKGKANKIFFGILVAGLLLVGLAFAYFFEILPGATQPCSATYQASNCGDADFSGIGELILGAPLVIVGFVGLVVSHVTDWIRHRGNK